MVKKDVVVRNVVQDFYYMLFQLLLVDHDLHALSTQNVAWTNQQREAERAGKFNRGVGASYSTEFREWDAQFFEQ
ncbi:hypothetical protein D3C86_2071990 [compost metagenome]